MNYHHIPPHPQFLPQPPYPQHPIQFYPQFPPGLPHPQAIPPPPNPYAIHNYRPPPGLPPPAPHPHPLSHPPPPPPPPPAPLKPTENGWYIPPNAPPANETVVYETSRNGSPNHPSNEGDGSIHPYWHGRLAPLPGSCSPEDTFAPRKETQTLPHAIEIKTASNNDISLNTRHLLPPPSSGSSLVSPLSMSSSPSTDITSKIAEHGQLDKYADVFIPQYLKDIQTQSQKFTPLKAISLFPPPSYLSTFLPSSIIDRVQSLYPSTVLSGPPHPSRSHSFSSPNSSFFDEVNFPPLTPSASNHWRALLSWELDQQTREKEKIVLYQMNVSVQDWDQAEFAVCVVGIRENHPRLDIGDIIHLREVLVDWKCGSGVAFEGRITTLRKREGFIHFYCPALKQHIQTYIPVTLNQQIRDGLPVFTSQDKIPPVFNISFLTNARPSLLMERAAATLGAALSSGNETGKRGLAHRWLFPTNPTSKTPTRDLYPPLHPCYHPYPTPTVTVGSTEGSTPNNEPLLPQSHYINLPFRILLVDLQPEACILLCAPSNPATDTLALRLGKDLGPHEMLRLNDENRTFAEVPDGIRQFCYVDNDKFALPPFKQLMRYRVVITSCLDANILVAAECTNTTLALLEEHVMGSIHPHHMMKHQLVPHWTHLLIDEAAQGSEPELLIPISVVLTRPELLMEHESERVMKQHQHARKASIVSYNYHPLALTPQLVLCGDPNQLGPIITSDEARAHELDISLLERLFESPLYAEHSEARSRLHLELEDGYPHSPTRNHNHVQNHRNVKPFKPFANLVKNYRSHPAILMPPSAMFYNDSLEPYATNGFISWNKLPNNKFPLMFVGCDSKEEDVSESFIVLTWFFVFVSVSRLRFTITVTNLDVVLSLMSRATWFNPGEIASVVDIILSMMKNADKCSPVLTPAQIGVMAPWREQVWKMREALRKVGLGAVDVGSVEDFQGREKRIVIISCVRSSARFLKEDEVKGIGLVFEKKRMNVAITRAKELLVVVGNGELLKRDPYWKGFLQFALRNKLYVGPDLGLELDGAWISRLESQILQAQEETGLLDADDSEDRNTMMLAGDVAREVLRED
ncbi:hypothetical protein D9758_015674 [Tetrapyrgos nigripes]|uniref:DNA2/NAM7 helicase-like C-terminal domain-containing protein n=1 Tax=Tetrapyrgos nigripes TaxID=182062 RepID=A0A8H5FHK2_9AGAR|nr:hypothetical protein D9758_015674 [Tetrapyrgos nigripes]